MKKLTKEMRKLLADAVAECGSQMEFQRRTGIRQSTINKILNGKSQSVADRTWRDITLHINSDNQNQIINTGNNNNFFADNINDYKSKLIEAVIDLDIDDTSRTKVLKLIKSIKE